MYKTPTLQRVITAIAARHGLNLAELGAHLTLTLPGYMRLAIEVIEPNHLSIAHYYLQNGDLIPDPDVQLVMLNQGWAPYAITQLGRYRSYIQRDQVCGVDSGALTDRRGQADLADFCEFWGRNLEAQGWASERAQREGDEDATAGMAVAA